MKLLMKPPLLRGKFAEQAVGCAACPGHLVGRRERRRSETAPDQLPGLCRLPSCSTGYCRTEPTPDDTKERSNCNGGRWGTVPGSPETSGEWRPTPAAQAVVLLVLGANLCNLRFGVESMEEPERCSAGAGGIAVYREISSVIWNVEAREGAQRFLELESNCICGMGAWRHGGKGTGQTARDGQSKLARILTSNLRVGSRVLLSR